VLVPALVAEAVLLVLACREVDRARKYAVNEARNISILQTEYDNILEKMPEGILIVSKVDEKVEFINEELRDVVNMQLDSNEEDGLKAQIFRKYDIVQEIKETG
jgi:sensor histidine kinase regulating citrate/malate metabolism